MWGAINMMYNGFASPEGHFFFNFHPPSLLTHTFTHLHTKQFHHQDWMQTKYK